MFAAKQVGSLEGRSDDILETEHMLRVWRRPEGIPPMSWITQFTLLCYIQQN